MTRIRKQLLKSRTARYFIKSYNRAFLRDAIELAAQRERGKFLEGFHAFCKIPIDVEKIAKKKRITIYRNLPVNSDADAYLKSESDKFILRLKPKLPERRIRFTIAHEIGHALFFNGPSHRIGILDKTELEAEELICQMFAGALLMPPENVRKFAKEIKDGPAWSVLTSFEKPANIFKVSLPAWTKRIGNLSLQNEFSFIVLCLKYFSNKYTNKDPCLRVDTYSSVGKLKNLRTWYNRSAKGLNFKSAEDLFDAWVNNLKQNKEPTGGRYTINSNGVLVRASPDSVKWNPEKLNVSVLINNKWYKRRCSVETLSCLYARKGWGKGEAYIISIIKLPPK